jgi:hypothetical protein
MPNKLPPIDTDRVARRIEGLRNEFSDQANAFNHLATKVKKGHDKAVGELIEALFAKVKELTSKISELESSLESAGHSRDEMDEKLSAVNGMYTHVQRIEGSVQDDATLVTETLATATTMMHEIQGTLDTMKTKYDSQFAKLTADEYVQFQAFKDYVENGLGMTTEHFGRIIAGLGTDVRRAVAKRQQTDHGNPQDVSNHMRAGHSMSTMDGIGGMGYRQGAFAFKF